MDKPATNQLLRNLWIASAVLLAGAKLLMTLVPDQQQLEQRRQAGSTVQEASKAHDLLMDSHLMEEKTKADQERLFRTLTDTQR